VYQDYILAQENFEVEILLFIFHHSLSTNSEFLAVGFRLSDLNHLSLLSEVVFPPLLNPFAAKATITAAMPLPFAKYLESYSQSTFLTQPQLFP